ncbi:MarR family winged helix-turn-helix transcriptional regulator [Actinospica sp.]|jgi:DNA-binding MarR family transcriptional regulator|uniref:MarR family winged helix-turn-helix transcriptional regulator n=1 Tax=Actinospica sp. TaxID=1872142 RepID=UPI002CA1115A|nr:MarR family winged helix-turn-helix transcriptional regulator [Actinospica sp.]HWG26595.1 MarR family winged helix-turn-helix transcriptional regulator [Actinospica sp.]
MTDWLTDDEQRAWRGLLHMTAQLNARLARQLQDEHEISIADYDILVRLYEAPEHGLRARDLEASLLWEQSRLSHQLSRMQRRGLVERGDCPSDRRGATFAITDVGRAAIEHAAPGHVAAVRRLFFDHLTPDDVARLDELTGRIISRLS